MCIICMYVSSVSAAQTNGLVTSQQSNHCSKSRAYWNVSRCRLVHQSWQRYWFIIRTAVRTSELLWSVFIHRAVEHAKSSGVCKMSSCYVRALTRSTCCHFSWYRSFVTVTRPRRGRWGKMHIVQMDTRDWCRISVMKPKWTDRLQDPGLRERQNENGH